MTMSIYLNSPMLQNVIGILFAVESLSLFSKMLTDVFLLERWEWDYKDNSRNILNKLVSCKMMLERNLKGNYKKIFITDTKIIKFIVGKLFLYEKIRMNFFCHSSFWDNVNQSEKNHQAVEEESYTGEIELENERSNEDWRFT